MNDDNFVVTYGPKPKIWCRTCRHDTPLVAGIDGTLRPGDVEQTQSSHRCGPPPSPWEAGLDSRGSLVAAGQGGER